MSQESCAFLAPFFGVESILFICSVVTLLQGVPYIRRFACDRSLQTIPFEELLNAFWGFLYLLAKKCFFLGKCWMFSPLYRIIFQKHAPFWGNVEYVQFFGEHILKMRFFLGKCWICSICSIPRETWGGNVSLGIEHIEHIQHFPRKKHIFGKESQLDSTYSTFPQKEAHFPCMYHLKNHNIQHFSRKGDILGKMSPFPLKCWMLWGFDDP